jgi:Fe-S-cluster containining protein
MNQETIMPVPPQDLPQSNGSRCRRCGTCCTKGGPALHIADRELVNSGTIPLKHLMTIRQGEPAYDNVTQTLAPAVTDIIKIAGSRDGVSACVFYASARNRCKIYGTRPCECEALKCWDTREIERIYRSQRLTRRHLLAGIEGLWELVQEHQARCDYGTIAELAARVSRTPSDSEAEQQLVELIHYDDALREATVQRAGHTAQMLTFLFGRPLRFTLQMFKLRLTPAHRGESLVRTQQSPMCYRRHRIG